MKTSTVRQAMKYSTKISLMAGCGLVLLSSALPVLAQSLWDGGGGDGKWSTAQNWQGDAVPASATTTVIQFGGSAQTTVDVDSAIAAQSLTFNSGAGAFTLNNNSIALTSSAAGVSNLVNSSANLQTINSALTITSGGINASQGNMQINGAVTVAVNGFRLGAGIGKTLTVSGAIGGGISGDTFAINTSGGTVVLNNAANSWTGGMKVWNGTVIANGDAPNSWSSAGIFGKNGGEIQIGTAGGGSSAVLTGGAYTLANKFRIVSNSNAAAVYTLGGTSASNATFSGSVLLGSTSGITMGVKVTATDSGRVNMTGGIQREATSTGTGDIVTKTGNGVVAVSGSSTYQGTTSISSGVMLFNGTASAALATGTVSVGTGATLGGNGNVVRHISVLDGASFSAGDMDLLGNSLVGTFTVGEAANNANFTLSNTSVLNFDLGSTSNYDKVVVFGDLTLDGTLNLNALSGFNVGTYTLFTYTGVIHDNDLTHGSSLSGLSYTLDTSTNGVVNLIVVPEPGSAALLVSSVVFLGVWVGRKRLTRERVS